MFADRRLAPCWLQLRAMPSNGVKAGSVASATPVPEEKELLDIVAFESWTGIDEDAVEVGALLNCLPKNDRHRDILSEAVDYSNKYVISLKEKYEGLSVRAGVGDEDAANAFSELVTVASKALRVPNLRQGLLCEPWQIEKKHSEQICCSMRTETTENETVSESSFDSVIFDEGSTTKPVATRVIKPDITMYSTLSQFGTSGMPVIAVEGKKPLIRFADSLRGTYETQTSAAKMMEKLFDRVREDRNLLNDEEVIFYLSFCQSMVYALQTESQSAILTNHNETLFLRVAKLTMENTTEITVAVSSLYDEKTLLCGLIAFIRRSFSEDYGGTVEWQERVEFLRFLNEEDPDYVPDWFELEEEEGHLDFTQLLDDGDATQGHASSRTVELPALSAKASSISEKRVPVAGNSTHGNSPNSVVKSNRGKNISGYALLRVMNHNFGFLSTSGYNKVLLCRLADQRFVAMKYFYSLEEKKVASKIEHEVRMLSLLENRCSGEYYGDFVAELLAYGVVKAFGMVLVTAYVGFPLSRKGSRLVVGHEFVGDADALLNAAVSSLLLIHRVGILHGDVSLRNMRAQRYCDGRWKVWWLDFGDAKESKRSAAFREELMDCRAMFDGLE